jgi:RimJ/RimL family protein N-acetyltransferase
MTPAIDPSLIDVPMPIRTPRLLIRPTQTGDGAPIAAAVLETWNELHRWMAWADTPESVTPERQEARIRDVTQAFSRRAELNLLGIELTTGHPVVWCGFHDIDWNTRQCDTGYWVRRSAQRCGFATEATNALLRYAFGALRMRRVGITYSAGNKPSARIVEKLGFRPEGVLSGANQLPGGRSFDRHCFARYDALGLPSLAVRWGKP